MENLTKFHVWVAVYGDSGKKLRSVRCTEYAVDRETAKDQAVKGMVRSAKAYNAKYHESLVASGLDWGLQSDSFDTYKAEKVRKAPVRN